MAIYNNILETIGNTPIVRLKKFEDLFDLEVELYAKLESFNPANNVKVRPAFEMIKRMYEELLIDSTYTLIESTSGNTGIGIAMVGAYYGNNVIIVMPETVSKERIDVLKHYGAKVILTKGEEGIKGSDQLVEGLLKEIKPSIKPSQFKNPHNPLAHYLKTAKEIEADLNDLDYIFITVGTGGTVSGIGKYYKENHKKTKIIAIEPTYSPVLSGGVKGPHKIQGIGPGFIPENFKSEFVDEILGVKDEDAYRFTKLLPKLEGISGGISSGACLARTIEYLKTNKIKSGKVCMIFPDSGEKYFSTGVFE
jgi:cysteine synthase A